MLGEYYITALIPWWELPTVSPILFLPWMGAIVYAIWRYSFLVEKILDSVKNLVILYDTDGRAVYRNRKAKDIYGERRGDS